MKQTVRIDGLKELNANLKKLGMEAKKQIIPALRKSAWPLCEEASRRAPVDEGDLEGGIGVYDVHKSAGGIFIDVGTNKDHFWDLFQEFGFNLTRGRRKATKKVLKKVPAQPYMRPAFDMLKADIFREIGRQMSFIFKKGTGWEKND